jgi:antirestriction protein ArdC
MKKVNAKEIQEKVTAKVIAALESAKTQGEKWVRPWRSVNGDEAQRFDGYVYQGINQLMLSITAGATGKMNVWGTPAQWGELAKKRGERFDFRGSKCVAEILRPNTAKVTKGTGEMDDKGEEIKNTFAFVKSFTVYPVMSISDVRGTENLIAEIEAKNALPEHETHAQAEAFIAAQGAETAFGGNRACYSPVSDAISMPALGQFDKPANYYATFIHELTHRTGHKSRLNRPGIVNFDRFGSEQYAEEELVAELGAAFTCNALGIDGETMDSHSQYIESWLKKLQSDKRFIFKAATAAQAAMAYMFKQTGASIEGEA